MGSALADLLNRPIDQRFREFKYRCAQSIVFGIPVLALQWFGPRLGGIEAPRWIAILQAILCGWIVYVAAAGMLFEGLVARTLKTCPDLIVGVIAMGAYLMSVIGAVSILIGTRRHEVPLMF